MTYNPPPERLVISWAGKNITRLETSIERKDDYTLPDTVHINVLLPASTSIDELRIAAYERAIAIIERQLAFTREHQPVAATEIQSLQDPDPSAQLDEAS